MAGDSFRRCFLLTCRWLAVAHVKCLNGKLLPDVESYAGSRIDPTAQKYNALCGFHIHGSILW